MLFNYIKSNTPPFEFISGNFHLNPNEISLRLKVSNYNAPISHDVTMYSNTDLVGYDQCSGSIN